MAPEPSATVRNTADGEEARQGARRRHENSRFGAKTGLPIHAPMSRESCAEGIGFYERALAQLNSSKLGTRHGASRAGRVGAAPAHKPE